jgi:hypothetical protein
LTKLLVLHYVNLVIAGVSFFFGLLAFLGTTLAVVCSSCFCGFSAAASLGVFIFDIAFYSVIKLRVVNDHGGSVLIGNATWLTGIATLLLFLFPILFLVGKCCGCCTYDGKRKAYDKEYSGGMKQ